MSKASLFDKIRRGLYNEAGHRSEAKRLARINSGEWETHPNGWVTGKDSYDPFNGYISIPVKGDKLSTEHRYFNRLDSKNAAQYANEENARINGGYGPYYKDIEDILYK